MSKLPHRCNKYLHTNSRAASPCCDWLNYLSTGKRGYVPTSDGHALPIEEELRRKTFTPTSKCCQVKNVLPHLLRSGLCGSGEGSLHIVLGESDYWLPHGLVGPEKINCGSRFSYLKFIPANAGVPRDRGKKVRHSICRDDFGCAEAHRHGPDDCEYFLCERALEETALLFNPQFQSFKFLLGHALQSHRGGQM